MELIIISIFFSSRKCKRESGYSEYFNFWNPKKNHGDISGRNTCILSIKLFCKVKFTYFLEFFNVLGFFLIISHKTACDDNEEAMKSVFLVLPSSSTTAHAWMSRLMAAVFCSRVTGSVSTIINIDKIAWSRGPRLEPHFRRVGPVFVQDTFTPTQTGTS